jgi:hypothetical protein
MGNRKKLTQPELVKLIMAMITNNKDLFNQIENILEKKFGKIDYRSKIIEFNFTTYYEKEMGKNLLRKFLSFNNLIYPDKIKEIKKYSNKLEEKFSTYNKRNINLDPGYINLGKLVLASTKDNLQRIYLGEGIYAEVTLYYKNKKYNPFFYTYPDYCSKDYIEIFEDIRNLFYKQIHPDVISG